MVHAAVFPAGEPPMYLNRYVRPSPSILSPLLPGPSAVSTCWSLTDPHPHPCRCRPRRTSWRPRLAESCLEGSWSTAGACSSLYAMHVRNPGHAGPLPCHVRSLQPPLLHPSRYRLIGNILMNAIRTGRTFKVTVATAVQHPLLCHHPQRQLSRSLPCLSCPTGHRTPPTRHWYTTTAASWH